MGLRNYCEGHDTLLKTGLTLDTQNIKNINGAPYHINMRDGTMKSRIFLKVISNLVI